MKSYETMFIVTPVLTNEQSNGVMSKVKEFIIENNGVVVDSQIIGLKKLAYPIQHKNNGLYMYLEFQSEPSVIKSLEILYKRDSNILRFMTCSLDKYGVEFNKNKRLNKDKVKDEKDTMKVHVGSTNTVILGE